MKSGKPLIPVRVTVGILGNLGCTLVYILRSCLSVAIIAMVDEKAVLEDKERNSTALDVCYDIGSLNMTKESHFHGTYVWSESIQGIVLGSYFYGYTVTQVLGSYADKFGAKWMTGLGVFAPAICNALIPVFADIHYSLVILMRILIGGLHGLVYPSLYALFARWFPQNEKSMAVSGTTVLGNLGGIITMPIAAALIELEFLGGWPNIFYLFSLIHLIWFILFWYFVSNSPEEDTRISERELKYIMANNPISKDNKIKAIPWRKIMTSKVVWASTVSKATGNFSYYLLCSNMPQYLDSVFGMAISKNSWFNSLMYAVLCIALVSANPLSKWIHSKRWISQTRNRKNFQSFAMFGTAVCLLLVPLVGCNSNAAVALLLVGMFIYGFITGGEYGVIPEYAPALSGTVFGVSNSISSTTGFLGPMLVGFLLDHGDGSVRKQWNIVWYISAAVYIFGGIFYEIFGSAEPQEWAVLPEDNHEKYTEKKFSNIDHPTVEKV